MSSGPVAAQPAASEPAHLHRTVRGDTLIGLGRKLLAEPRQWPELARANNLRNPNRLATGVDLQVPLRLMRSEPVAATVLQSTGPARGPGATPLSAGQPLPEGSDVTTGAEGHATVRLVDGTVLRLRPGSRLTVRESQRYPAAGAVRSGVRLDEGRVEVDAAPAPAGRPGFRLDTPQGVLGVRGTEYRAAVDAGSALTRGEVLGGAVAFEGAGGTTRVEAGFGAVIGATGEVTAPVRLLGAPGTTALPVLQDRLLVRFEIPPVTGAAAYRGLVARDDAFTEVLADLTAPGPELRFAGLPDGPYVLRVRAIDAQGLEGLDAQHAFVLRARPEAPLPAAPAPRAVLTGGSVDFAWTANDDAQSYQLQVTVDADGRADFTAPVHDLRDLRALTARIEGLAPGVYHWRLASVRADGDRGPWGSPRRFEMRPAPAVPPAPVVGDQSISFAWEGRPGQTFEFQIARDAAFTAVVLERTLDQPGIEVPPPGSGRFYVRLRARDPDGFIGPYTTTQYFDVPHCLRSAYGGCVRASGAPVSIRP